MRAGGQAAHVHSSAHEPAVGWALKQPASDRGRMPQGQCAQTFPQTPRQAAAAAAAGKAALSRRPATATAKLPLTPRQAGAGGGGKRLEDTVLTTCPPALEGLPLRREGSNPSTTCAQRSKGEEPRSCRPTSPHLLRPCSKLAPLLPGLRWWLPEWDKRGPWTPPSQVSPSPKPAKGAGTSTCRYQREARGRSPAQPPEQSPRSARGWPSRGSQARGRPHTRRPLARQRGSRAASGGGGLHVALSQRALPCPTQARAAAAGIRTTWEAVGPGAAYRALLSLGAELPLIDQWNQGPDLSPPPHPVSPPGSSASTQGFQSLAGFLRGRGHSPRPC